MFLHLTLIFVFYLLQPTLHPECIERKAVFINVPNKYNDMIVSAEEKGTSPQDYRYHLRMWAKEKDSKKETIKDLPKMSQEQFIELCKTLYNMFSEDPVEQELYHAIATVASLLLRIGEVGKKFSHQPTKKAVDCKANNSQDVPSEEESPTSEQSQNSTVERYPQANTENKASGDVQLEKHQQENQIFVDGGGEGPGSPIQMLSDDETKDDMSMSSYSMVSTGSLQCEDIADDTVLVGCEAASSVARYGSTIDTDWSISFEQILASVLTETALVNYFEKKIDITQKIKEQKKVERQCSSSSDYELSSVSG
uniref:TBC1 domain member 9B n=1 Tax=Sphaerodactylus townsendi TaxID=933632 RepID=A0ACB8EJ48_9SAUR